MAAGGDIGDGEVEMTTETQFNAAWDAIIADPELVRARAKLSIHEFRQIIRHCDRAFSGAHSADMQALAITTARVLRAHVSAEADPDQEDLWAMNDALKPFDPLPEHGGDFEASS